MSASQADLESKISEIIAGWIPGDGVTEVGVELNDADNDNINFSIINFTYYFFKIINKILIYTV